MAVEHYDLAVIGGGPVGAALLHALADSGLRVALVESRSDFTARDPRAIALSQGTRLILERLGVWADMQTRATAIETIHVSQAGGFGRAVLSANDLDLPALGYTVEYGDLYAALATDLPATGATLITGARATAVRPAAGCGLLEYRRDGVAQSLTARLLVVADGGRSLGAGAAAKDYAQAAVVCWVRSELAHAHRAYERFTPRGPIALLPLGGSYALVWTTPAAQLDARLGLSDAAFLDALQDAFGDRQGRFLDAGPRAAFPLRLAIAPASAQSGLVRIGNAAQTLHPVAGQGFNLGLRDAWWLAECVQDTARPELGGAAFLSAYRRRRRWDVSGGALMTDLLVELFGADLPLLSQGRGLALTALDLLPPLKRAFARKMMFGAQA